MFEQQSEYSPIEHYASSDAGPPPRIFGAPGRYVQGPRVLARAGHYVSCLGVQHAAVLSSTRSRSAEGKDLVAGLDAAEIRSTAATFGGECSAEEIRRHADALSESGVDVLFAVGGGKCVDAGKGVAHRLNIPLVVVPTLASNDAPCSAVSMVYTPDGVSDDVEWYPHSPAMVIVDTTVVAAATERYLVAGIGDAMATWYEARATASAGGLTCMGGRPTLAAGALSELCARTLYEHGSEAARAVADDTVTEVLERVVEANTLLSGLGFESGGVAAAHGLAQGFTVVPSIEHENLHGELVAMGLLVQLGLERDADELARAARFFAEVGLPIHLGQLGVRSVAREDLERVIEATMQFPFLSNLPVEVTPTALRASLEEADRLGRRIADAVGESALERVRGA